MADPQRLADRMATILARRGLNSNSSSPTAQPPGQATAGMETAQDRIPARYRNAIGDHPGLTRWVEEIIRSARPGPGGTPGISTGPSVLIAGPTGTGKTHQAYGAVRSLLTAGVRLRWQAVTAADLYAGLRPRPGHDPEAELRTLARCPLLLLDDLGASKSSEWTEEITYRLINARYEHLRPTLVTTNLAIRDLREVLGDRVTSRLAEMTRRVTLTGDDRRRATVRAA